MKSPKKHLEEGIPTKFNYYLLRIAQRWSLFSLIGFTIIYWVVQISETVNMRFMSAAGTSLSEAASTSLRNEMLTANDLLETIIMRWIIVCTFITLCLLFYVRVRKYEKRLVIDSLVAIAFSLLSVILSQIAIKSFINQL